MYKRQLLLLDYDSSFGNLFFYFKKKRFSDFIFNEMYVRHAVSMAVEVIFYYVQTCRSYDMSSFFHVPKQETGPSLLTPYVNVGLRIMYSM